MSKANKGATEGDQDGLPESEETAIDAIAKISSHLASIAVGADGKLLPEAEFQMAIRSGEGRSKILANLVNEVAPNGVSEARWKVWLNGGKTPFEKPKKTADGQERPAQTLTRSSNKVVSQQKRVDRIRSELAAAEHELAYVKAYENASLHWHVVNQLVEIMDATFAMGPAWTIMRAISGYVSDEAADKATYMFFGDEKVHTMAEYRVMRVKETAEIFSTLDGLSGVDKFEEALREAVLKVCRDFEGRREELVTDGRRQRSAKAMKESAHPKAQRDAEEVLEGLPTG